MSVRHLTLAFAVLALLPATASAAEIYPSVSPTVLRGDGPWSITYKIEVDAGPAPERLLLSVDGSQTYPSGFQLEGDGKVTDGPSMLGSAIAYRCGGLTGTPDPVPGFGGGGTSLLDLPAGGTALLTMTAVLGEQFGLGVVQLEPVRVEVAEAPLDYDVLKGSPSLSESVNPRRLAFESIHVATRRSIPLSLRLRPPGGTNPVAPGMRVAITGKTTPLIAGQAIELRARYSPQVSGFGNLSSFPIGLARVRVQPDGSFSYRGWRPPAIGRYFVAAYYSSHDARFYDAAVAGCSPTLQVALPEPG